MRSVRRICPIDSTWAKVSPPHRQNLFSFVEIHVGFVLRAAGEVGDNAMLSGADSRHRRVAPPPRTPNPARERTRLGAFGFVRCLALWPRCRRGDIALRYLPSAYLAGISRHRWHSPPGSACIVLCLSRPVRSRSFHPFVVDRAALVERSPASPQSSGMFRCGRRAQQQPTTPWSTMRLSPRLR